MKPTPQKLRVSAVFVVILMLFRLAVEAANVRRKTSPSNKVTVQAATARPWRTLFAPASHEELSAASSKIRVRCKKKSLVSKEGRDGGTEQECHYRRRGSAARKPLASLLENEGDDFGPIPNITPLKRRRNVSELQKIRGYEATSIVGTLMTEGSLLLTLSRIITTQKPWPGLRNQTYT